MHEWDAKENQQGKKADLESRLAAYYGPELHEQPLPQSVWLRTQANLGLQRSARHMRVRWIFRHRNMRSKRVPEYIQDAFSRIVHEARIQGRSPILRCSLKAAGGVPGVHTSFLGRGIIKLVLPASAAGYMERAMLDVLLATGLARCCYARRLENWLLWVLLAVVVALSFVMLMLWVAYKYSVPTLLIAVLICAVVMGLILVQRRRLVFRADELTVRWLGRSRVCQGLHLLAGRSPTRRWVVWVEPSLTERIERVCGTRVEVEDERLTLVR